MLKQGHNGGTGREAGRGKKREPERRRKRGNLTNLYNKDKTCEHFGRHRPRNTDKETTPWEIQTGTENKRYDQRDTDIMRDRWAEGKKTDRERRRERRLKEEKVLRPSQGGTQFSSVASHVSIVARLAPASRRREGTVADHKKASPGRKPFLINSDRPPQGHPQQVWSVF